MKRMPYTTPDGFLEKVQENAVAEAAKIRRRRQTVAGGVCCALAGLIIWAFLPSGLSGQDSEVFDSAANQIADASLSSNEYQMILDSYDCDIFLENLDEQ